MNTLEVKGFKIDKALFQSKALNMCRLEECQGSCCNNGAYVSVEQSHQIIANKDLFLPFLSRERQDADLWFEKKEFVDADHPFKLLSVGTQTIIDSDYMFGKSCIFLRKDWLCAIQLGSVNAGKHPWKYKPLYCVLHPLDFADGILTFKKYDPPENFERRCFGSDNAEPTALYKLFHQEIKFLLSESGFAELDNLAF